MNIRQCEVLVSIAKTHSVTKAALELNCTQPTVSFHMKSLEQDTKQTLFLQRSGETLLSDSAKILLEYAQKILILDQDAKERMNFFQNDFTRPLIIGASMVAAKYILPPYLQSFLTDYPSLSIQLISCAAPEIEKKVAQFELDFGIICTQHPKHHSDLSYTKLFSQEMVLAYTFLDPSVDYNRPIEHWIEKVPFIQHDKPSSLYQLVNEWAQLQHKQLNVRVEASSTELIKSLVLDHFGVSILPLDTIKKEKEEGKCFFRPLDPPLTRDVYLVFNKNRILLPVAQQLIERIQHS